MSGQQKTDEFSSTPAFNLLQYVVLVELYEEYLYLYRHIVGKEKGI